MATSDSPLSVPNITLAVARGAPATGNPLVSFDFAAGDTLSSPSINTTGFAFAGSGTVTTIEAAPSGQLGLKFPFLGSAFGDAWAEIRYSMGAQLFENYERMVLWVPSNYTHRFIKELTVDPGTDLSAWVRGDVVAASDGTTAIYQGTSISGTDKIIYLKNTPDATWTGTVTNQTRSLVATVTSTSNPPTNNKFSAQWANGYSGNNSIIELLSSRTSPDSYFTHQHYSAGGVNDSPTTPQARSSVPSLPEYIYADTDAGALVDFVIRRRRSTAGDVSDGLVEIYKNGVLAYSRSLAMYAEGANYFEAGYLMGYSNSGFDEDTIFYLTKYELYDGTRPEGLQ